MSDEHKFKRRELLAPAAAGAAFMIVPGSHLDEESSSDWVLVTSRPSFFDLPDIRRAEKPIDPIPGLRMWTDDYSNLYKILR